MTTEVDLTEVLEALVGGRVYPDAAPLDEELPLITWQQAGGIPINFLGGEPVDKQHARIQINVFSESRLESKSLMVAIEKAVVQTPLFATVLGAAIAGHNAGTNIRQMHQDFGFWFEY